MCSWCWGFAPAIKVVEQNLPEGTDLQYVMGGLARDTDEPMPPDMRQYIQHHWRDVQERTGAEFNWDFWTQCQPRRATYPACRAVLAAAEQNAGPAMFGAIQRAYYLEARNPSDIATLIELSGGLDLDPERFAADIASPAIEAQLQENFITRRRLQANAFPSLVLEKDGACYWITRGYENADIVLDRLQAALAA